MLDTGKMYQLLCNAWRAKPAKPAKRRRSRAQCAAPLRWSSSRQHPLRRPHARRKLQDGMASFHVNSPSLQWKHARSRRHGRAARCFGRQRSSCKRTWRQSRSAPFDDWLAAYCAPPTLTLMTSSSIRWPMSVLPATLTAS